MAKYYRRLSKKGLAPGSLIHIGEKLGDKVDLSVISYSPENFSEQKNCNLEACLTTGALPDKTWINVDGLHDPKIIEAIGKHFGIHSLTLEDILHTYQRPKYENFGEHLYIIVKALNWDEKNKDIRWEQLSIIITKNTLITFGEKPGDIFEPIREHIRKDRAHIRNQGIDYLLLSILDVIIDNYFYVLEKIGEKMDDLESVVLKNPTPEQLINVHKMKREIIYLRRATWPVREIIQSIERDESPLMDPSHKGLVKDLHDHIVQVIETIETFRDMGMGLLDMALTVFSNRLNEIMKVLTIIATIFIPLTFIVGIYGMNFHYMPELSIKWAYPALMGFMGLIGGLMVFYFRKKRWL
jgi:magnesium transporter